MMSYVDKSRLNKIQSDSQKKVVLNVNIKSFINLNKFLVKIIFNFYFNVII